MVLPHHLADREAPVPKKNKAAKLQAELQAPLEAELQALQAELQAPLEAELQAELQALQAELQALQALRAELQAPGRAVGGAVQHHRGPSQVVERQPNAAWESWQAMGAQARVTSEQWVPAGQDLDGEAEEHQLGPSLAKVQARLQHH